MSLAYLGVELIKKKKKMIKTKKNKNDKAKKNCNDCKCICDAAISLKNCNL